MGEIVNLRRVKKARDRAAAAERAAANRARHGISKTEREAEAKRRERRDAELDGARLPPRDD